MRQGSAGEAATTAHRAAGAPPHSSMQGSMPRPQPSRYRADGEDAYPFGGTLIDWVSILMALVAVVGCLGVMVKHWLFR